MPTPRETILSALFTTLQTMPNTTALRGEVLPERIPAGGLVILRDGEPGEVRFADTTLLNQAINGTAAELKFTYSLTSGESFELTAHAVYLPRPRLQIQGPQGIQASFDWQAAYDSVAGQMCTATLINDIATY